MDFQLVVVALVVVCAVMYLVRKFLGPRKPKKRVDVPISALVRSAKRADPAKKD